jgi:hypothetical protein
VNRRLERLLVSAAAGCLLGLAVIGGFEWLLERREAFLATFAGVALLVYSVELAVANGLEARRADDLKARRQDRAA